MAKKSIFFFVLLFNLIFIVSCSSNGDDDTIEVIQIDNDDTDDDSNDDESENDTSIDRESLATNGCLNVIIFNGYAYAACGDELEVISLGTLERNLISIAADDISVDPDAGLLFIQSGQTVQVLELTDPMEPSIVASTNTNFRAFSGLSAANNLLVVSAGASGSNTQIYTYTSNSISLVTNGIPVVDNTTGNPDVHVISLTDGVRAFYSQDIGALANWAVQIADIDSNGNVTSTPPAIVLTSGQFTGSFNLFGPANFPVESEFLDDRLYVANFAAQGIEIIDLNVNNELSLISLPYEPTNIGTDGTSLFVVGATNESVDIIDPTSATVTQSIGNGLQLPTGVAASSTHIAIADRSEGLIVITR